MGMLLRELLMDRAAVDELLAHEVPDDPPEGYQPVPTGSGFNLFFGPMYAYLAGGRLMLGMRIGRRHINPHGTCHGGVLASFADMQVYSSQKQDATLREILLPTVNMTLDYISPAVLGDWLVGETQLLRKTGTMLFQQTIVSVSGRVVLRASCIYRNTGRTAPEGSALGSLFPD